VNLAAAAIGHTITWGQWALAAIVPGTICLIGAPYIMYLLNPPEVKETPDAPKLADTELSKMGPMSVDEKIMAGALLVTVRPCPCLRTTASSLHAFGCCTSGCVPSAL